MKKPAGRGRGGLGEAERLTRQADWTALRSAAYLPR